MCNERKFLNMQGWTVAKGSGIFNNKRLPNYEKLSKSVNTLISTIEEYNKNDTSDENVEIKKQITYMIIQTLRNYQALLYTWSINKDAVCNISPKIVSLLNSISEKLDVSKELKDFSKVLVGDINSFIKSVKNDDDTKDIERKLYTIIHGNGGINKFTALFKESAPTYTHSLMSDASRISFSSSFRRLQDKAQVFPLEVHDYARTRLTHTIEVKTICSQIGNLCGQGLSPKNNAEKKEFAFLTEKVLICSALLHDMGNPPFGHFGEDAIKDFFNKNWNTLKYNCYDSDNIIQEKQLEPNNHNTKTQQMKHDFTCFDGNAQSLRIATKEQKFKDGEPLNLTAAVLGSIIKYPCNSYEGVEKQKFGYFYSENDIIKNLTSMGVYINHYRNPLAMLLEAADDISYVTSDLVDAVKKQALTFQVLDREIKLIKSDLSKYKGTLKKFIDDFSSYYETNVNNNIPEPFEYTILRMTTDLREDLIREIVKIVSEPDNSKKIFTDGIHYKKEKRYAKNLLRKYDSKAIPSKNLSSENLTNELLDCSSFSPLIKWIKNDLFKKHIYKDRNIIQNELIGYKVINELLEVFVDAVLKLDFRTDNNGNFKNLNHNNSLKKEEKIFNLISKNFIEQFKLETKDIDVNSFEHVYFRLRLVVDYISGMTDGYAVEIHNVLK